MHTFADVSDYDLYLDDVLSQPTDREVKAKPGYWPYLAQGLPIVLLGTGDSMAIHTSEPEGTVAAYGELEGREAHRLLTEDGEKYRELRVTFVLCTSPGVTVSSPRAVGNTITLGPVEHSFSLGASQGPWRENRWSIDSGLGDFAQQAMRGLVLPGTAASFPEDAEAPGAVTVTVAEDYATWYRLARESLQEIFTEEYLPRFERTRRATAAWADVLEKFKSLLGVPERGGVTAAGYLYDQLADTVGEALRGTTWSTRPGEALLSDARRRFAVSAKRLDWSARPVGELREAIDKALDWQLVDLAMYLAQLGGRLFPGDEDLQRTARVLAPASVRRARAPEVRGLEASRAWLREHASEYRSKWLAVREGELLGAADSVEELEATVLRDRSPAHTIILKVE